MLSSREFRIAFKLLAIALNLLTLYVASGVLRETLTVFDYGRF